MEDGHGLEVMARTHVNKYFPSTPFPFHVSSPDVIFAYGIVLLGASANSSEISPDGPGHQQAACQPA